VADTFLGKILKWTLVSKFIGWIRKRREPRSGNGPRL
jgi:hypothetical protein